MDVLFFQGDNTLPTGPTPTTSALTQIAYSPNAETEAIVYYYSAEDWRRIENVARRHKSRKLGRATEDDLVARGCAELLERVQRSGIDPSPLLGSQERVAVSDLADFAGPASDRSALIHHIDVHSDASVLRDLRVVDTPGLNDTVVSREKLTRDSLNEADSIFFLSPASHFLDDKDLRTLQRLEEMGIDQVDILASRFDEVRGDPDNLLREFTARLGAKSGLQATIVAVSALPAKLHFKAERGDQLTNDEAWYRERFADAAPGSDLLVASNLTAVRELLDRHVAAKGSVLATGLRKRCQKLAGSIEAFIKGMIDHRESRLSLLEMDEHELAEELEKLDETRRLIELRVLRPEADQIIALFQQAFVDFRVQLDTYFKGIIEDVGAISVSGKNKPEHLSELTRHRSTIDDHLASPRTYIGLEGDLGWLQVKARIGQALLRATLPSPKIADNLRDQLASEVASIFKTFCTETLDSVYDHDSITETNEPVYRKISGVIDDVWRNVDHSERESILEAWRGLRRTWNQAADDAVNEDCFRERLEDFFSNTVDSMFQNTRVDLEEENKVETVDQIRDDLKRLQDLIELTSPQEEAEVARNSNAQ